MGGGITVNHEGAQSPQIVTAVCAYRYIESGCVTNLLELSMERVCTSFLIVEDTIVAHGRNHAVNLTYQKVPNFTHILFVDADQCYFNGDSVRKLVQADKDIISGITVMRSGDHRLTLDPLEDHVGVTDQVIEVRSTGFFFTLVKRRVFDALADYVENQPNFRTWFSTERSPRMAFSQEMDAFLRGLGEKVSSGNITSTKALEEAVQFGQKAHLHTMLIGEDIGFCRRAKEAGFRVFAHAGVRLGHIGNKIYHPNEYYESLVSKP